MTHEELRQAAMALLAKAFKGEETMAHVVQAAVTIIISPRQEAKDGEK